MIVYQDLLRDMMKYGLTIYILIMIQKCYALHELFPFNTGKSSIAITYVFPHNLVQNFNIITTCSFFICYIITFINFWSIELVCKLLILSIKMSTLLILVSA
jgi:hypothetical protein